MFYLSRYAKDPTLIEPTDVTEDMKRLCNNRRRRIRISLNVLNKPTRSN